MKRKGFSMVEVMTVILVIAILFVIGFNVYKQTHMNSQIDACESELRDAATGLQGYMTDYGKIVFTANPDTYEDTVEEFIDIINRQYLNHEIELIDVADDYTGFAAQTISDTDPWGGIYTYNFYTNDGNTGIDIGTSIPGMVIISSAGPDTLSNITEYSSDYSDDIIAVIDPQLDN